MTGRDFKIFANALALPALLGILGMPILGILGVLGIMTPFDRNELWYFVGVGVLAAVLIGGLVYYLT